MFFRPDGYLFDKEAILECIVRQKSEYARQIKEYERQKTKQVVCLYSCIYYKFIQLRKIMLSFSHFTTIYVLAERDRRAEEYGA